jgi:hypothetical protein
VLGYSALAEALAPRSLGTMLPAFRTAECELLHR